VMINLSSKTFFCAMLILGGCAATKSEPQFVHVSVQYSDAGCTMRLDGRTVKADELLKMPRATRQDNASIKLHADTNVPWRCIGSVIYGLQALGYENVGFISEPPKL
jgi:biopolymer transport protein ExbD